MAGLSGLMSRVKKCQKTFSLLNRTPKKSIVYMDLEGNYMWEDGVDYNESVLAIPKPMTIDEWERKNIEM